MAPTIALPKGVTPGKGWRRRTTQPSYSPRQMTVIQSPMDKHPEKAFGVFSQSPTPGRMPVFIPGFGNVWTEDMKELLLRWEEKQVASEVEEKRVNRVEAWRQFAIEQIEERLAKHRANPVTDPAPLRGRALKGLF